MGVVVAGIEQGSVGASGGFCAGDQIERMNGHPIEDVLDYRFHMMNACLLITGKDGDGQAFSREIRKDQEQDLGLLFDTYLMDQQKSCRNRCVFCFIDQLPQGLRKSLYFKDDDSRMSFLFGNYITLTNLGEREIQRILDMHISPVNISVHTMNPALRMKMMGNRHAGEALAYIPRLVQGGIRVNVQLVLCPGWNDGEELVWSLRELCGLAPGLQSIAVVPVGLTAHREGLTELRLFSAEEAQDVLRICDQFGQEMREKHGQRICYAADEFYLAANRDIPPADWYEDFAQLENGVGMLALLWEEFTQALQDTPVHTVQREITVATGMAAAPWIQKMARAAEVQFSGLSIQVIPVENTFFGHTITVAGLVTATDICRQLQDVVIGQSLLLSETMLRREGDLFLDGTSLAELGHQLQSSIRTVSNDGYALLQAFLGESIDQ